MKLFSTDPSSKKSGHINVIAELKAKSGHEAELREALSGSVAGSRAEAGCLGYHLLEGKKSDGSFYTYEEWTGEDVLNDHLAKAKPMLAKLKPILDGEMKLTILNHLV